MATPTFRRQDPSGLRFGRLIVLREIGKKGRNYLWLCRCDCGAEIIRPGAYLRSGDTRSCGCLSRDTTAARNASHGLSTSPEYRIWAAMRERCEKSGNRGYPNYGGRGITVCERWRDFAAFYADMGPRPDPALTLERKDNDGPYSPDNCVWSTRTQQARNRRGRHYLTFQGKTQMMVEWVEETGISFAAIKRRLSRGWSVERTLTQPMTYPVGASRPAAPDPPHPSGNTSRPIDPRL